MQHKKKKKTNREFLPGVLALPSSYMYVVMYLYHIYLTSYIHIIHS